MRLESWPLGLYVTIDANVASIPEGALTQADDIEYFAGAGNTVKIRGRRGRTLFGTSVGKIHSIFRFYPRSGSATTLIAVQNAATVQLRHDTVGTGTFSTITGGSGFATNTRWRWVMWPALNKAFGVNGTDAFKSYDGAVVSTVTVSTGSVITGPYIALYKDRLFSCRPAFKDYLIDVSELLDPNNFSYAINISEDQGGQLVGLFGYGDVLIILKTSKVLAFAGDIRYSPQKAVISDKGCIAPNSADVTDYGVIYLGASGVCLTRGEVGDVQDISGSLKGLFFNAAGIKFTYPNAVGKYYQFRDQYWLTLDPANPLTTTYILTRLPLHDGTFALCWAKHTGLPMNSAGCWNSEDDDRRMLVGDATGKIWTVDFGGLDDAAAYRPTFVTAPIALGQRDELGRISRLSLRYVGTNPLTVGLRYNGAAADDITVALGRTLPAFAVQEEYKTIPDFTHWGRTVQLAVVSDTRPNFELHNLRPEARLKHGREWRRY